MLNIMVQPVATQRVPKMWTYQDFLDLPDDGQRYEIIEGVLYVSNAPSSEHQFTVLEIAAEIRQFLKQHKLGHVLVAPFEIHLSATTRPVQPDILFIRAERWPSPPPQYFEGAPDLVIEVISPSTKRTDHVIKFAAYEQAKVSEYWLVDPKTRSVDVYILSGGGEYALLGQFVGAEVIASQLLSGIQIITNTLFIPNEG